VIHPDQLTGNFLVELPIATFQSKIMRKVETHDVRLLILIIHIRIINYRLRVLQYNF
jgi:hypothetical protein